MRQGRKAVNQQDLLVSFEVVIAGTEKKGTVLTDMEKRIVSYHEVGPVSYTHLDVYKRQPSRSCGASVPFRMESTAVPT